ncbi:MAG: bifunctional oligoribonuclease/PAP phosphatase NrnA [Clostridia bacterium]|nr:bifunctional oligoribonuclease/PAP phosphatase NrnA [Clostridia bacterium]
MKNNTALLKQAIIESDKILLLTHTAPDGDALGSTAALKLLLQKMGKQPDSYVDDTFPAVFPHLKPYFTMAKETDTVYDLVILVDCADKTRTKFQYPVPKKIACIDHHISNPKNCDINIVDADSAATAEMMYVLMQEWQIPCDDEIAAAIYTGILTDTGGFLFQNTTKRTHEIAADLLSYSFDRNSIVRVSMLEKTMTYSALYAYLFETLTHFEPMKAVIGFIDYKTYQKFGATNDDTEGLSGVLRNITGIECGVLLTERESGTIKGSIRTNEMYNANELAGIFGGGGHMRAAGFRSTLSYDEIKEKIYEWLSAHQ